MHWEVGARSLNQDTTENEAERVGNNDSQDILEWELVNHLVWTLLLAKPHFILLLFWLISQVRESDWPGWSEMPSSLSL